MVTYCLLLPLSLSLEWSLSFLIPFLGTVHLTLKACDLASDWSLVVDPYIFSLVTCRVACCTMCGGGSSFCFMYLGWPCKRLVTCDWFQCSCTGHLHGRLCQIRGSWESLILEKSLQLHQAT